MESAPTTITRDLPLTATTTPHRSSSRKRQRRRPGRGAPHLSLVAAFFIAVSPQSLFVFRRAVPTFLQTVAADSNGDNDYDSDAWSSASSTDPVLRLTASTFDRNVFHSGKNGMVKFYQKWCGHCKKMKPIWDRIAEETHPSVFIANLDCGRDRDYCNEAGITAYPRLRYYVQGTEYDYDGARSYDAIREFIDAKLVERCDPTRLSSTVEGDDAGDGGKSDACSERARKYGLKWMLRDLRAVSAERERLERLMAGSEATTTAVLRRWMRGRKDMLDLIQEAKEGKEEVKAAGVEATAMRAGGSGSDEL